MDKLFRQWVDDILSAYRDIREEYGAELAATEMVISLGFIVDSVDTSDWVNIPRYTTMFEEYNYYAVLEAYNILKRHKKILEFKRRRA